MPNKNMKIWETLSKTNPEFTKPLPGYGGKTLTTIDPMYQIQMMTDLFGPVGLGWKYKVDYKYIDGLVFAEVTIKYFTNEWHEYGPVCSVQNLSKSNNKLDDEAPKKAMTDAMTKAFSHLGMSADVFLGKFDDSKYVEQMKQEFSQPQPQEIPKTNGKRNIKLDMQFNMDQIKKDIKAIDDIYLLRSWKKDNPNLFDSNQMSVREYRQITDLYGTRLTQLNQQGVV
ncbi:hypothetical protein [uncultured Mediterranean phage uvMED]|jgi:uncharacterized short protein YbdD (DUF466 family)|nr:hypothetical protein [uncultured Mediterranean phage uvMED]